MNNFHTPVLLKEVIDNLRVEKGKKYIDATIGGGGHTKQILKLGGMVLGMDVDQDSIDYLTEKIKNQKSKIKDWERLTLVKENFRDIDKIAFEQGFGHVKRGYGKVAGVLFDLGVSSHQLETSERGFSFQKTGPLDMRMDKSLQVRALDLIKILTKGELYEIFHKLGEESSAFALSKHIVRARSIKPIETTDDLRKIMEEVRPQRFSRINALAKVFQALRIVVNDELNALKEALPKALEVLGNQGRLLVISFHSLEDRIVKHNFIDFEKRSLGKIITKKPIRPSTEEISKNKRSRSAKLRVFERN